jgi:hypothetical protein
VRQGKRVFEKLNTTPVKVLLPESGAEQQADRGRRKQSLRALFHEGVYNFQQGHAARQGKCAYRQVTGFLKVPDSLVEIPNQV